MNSSFLSLVLLSQYHPENNVCSLGDDSLITTKMSITVAAFCLKR